MNRNGTILIIVAGICALLASLTLAFLSRARASLQETREYEAEVQARIMLVAGCSYICESSRIGYDTAKPGDDEHQEAFGWIDVRDGSEGPNTRYTAATGNSSYNSQYGANTVRPLFSTKLVERRYPGQAPVRPAWPAKGSVARCPMYVMERPPYAVELTAIYNPVNNNPSSAEFGLPLLKKQDPQPLIKDNFAEFELGDKRPRIHSYGHSWFRVYRETRLPAPALPSEGPATFIITVGSGGTQGFCDYDEVLAADEDLKSAGLSPRYAEEFNSDSLFFADLQAKEVRMWYRVEWSPTVASSMDHNIKNAWVGTNQHIFVSFPMNVSDSFRTQSHAHNQCGTIRWVQRLRREPSIW